jgi:hypothetical protein
MVVSVVSNRDPISFEALRAEIEQRLQQQLGVKVAASIVRPGDLDELTEFGRSPKPKRFRDDRGQTP